MTTVLLDEVVQTDYGQFDLAWSPAAGFDGDVDRFFSGQVNGLVGAADTHGVYVNLARRAGGSRVQIVLREAAPPPAEGGWEDVVEVTTSVPDGADARWLTWAGEDSGPLDVPPGDYRVRVSAKGRDAGAAGEFADGVLDEYLIELWLAASEPDAVLITTSRNAQYWHTEWGGRR
ncbi:MAG: hypothetical protein JWP11_1236 [Frankiales bacterium]|nr:hypothetical protein [Frankiales bacterium]